jgi:CHAD domain-containing protein/transposase-like protein
MSDFLLSEHERATLVHIRDHAELPESRRAQIILLSADSVTVAQITAAVGLSESQVYNWRREWKRRRMGIFPEPEAPVEQKQEEEPRPGIDAPRLPLELRDSVGALPDDPITEAARKVLLFNFERMLQHEPGSRRGEDIEAVHDMRVATRRMRSALRLFGPFFNPGEIKLFRHSLRDVAAALGDVRDLDVFIEKAQRFTQKRPKANLDTLVTTWQQRLDHTRAELIYHLDSKNFARFVRKYHTFLTTPGDGGRALDGAAYLARHVAPRLIYEHYENVRAYDTRLDGASLPTLHALRIAFKRFRYTLEFFEEILGLEIKTVIKETKNMQDHLGDLNDTDVALAALREFVADHNRHYSGVPGFMRPDDINGVLLYIAAQQAEQQRLLETLPAAWASFNRDEVRRALALAVAVL